MQVRRSHEPSAKLGLQKGEPFNPYRMFTGIFIPDSLVRCRWLSAGAKLAWGRLARYAGHDGRCYPTTGTLGREIGVGERQAQKYVAELERNELIRRTTRYSGRAQTSNAFEFLWHEVFEEGVNDRSGEGANDRSGGGANDRSPEESQGQESQAEETNVDLDSPSTNAKSSLSDRQYLRLREALANYMTTPEDAERIYPSQRQVVDVMDAAEGATEEEVIQCLTYLRDARGLKPGTKHGPRHFAWFKTVVGDYFRQKRLRQSVFSPAPTDTSRNGTGLTKEEFAYMTEAIEIPEVGGDWR